VRGGAFDVDVAFDVSFDVSAYCVNDTKTHYNSNIRTLTGGEGRKWGRRWGERMSEWGGKGVGMVGKDVGIGGKNV